MFYKEIDYSIVELNIKLFNTGSTALEYFKLSFEFKSKDIQLFDSNIEEHGGVSLKLYQYCNFYINKNIVRYSPHRPDPILVPQDGRQFTIYIKLPPNKFDFWVYYTFLSKEYNQNGKLKCLVEPDFEVNYITITPNEGEKERTYENVLSKKEEIEYK